MNIIIERAKREEYIKAWRHMYKSDKEGFNSPLYDGINPALNKKPLNTETDNFCTIAYDSDVPTEGFEYGKPVGIFSFVVTPQKIIGKQYVVHPQYLRNGIGKALLLVNEKTLLENGYDKYYIGCSSRSSGLYQKYLGLKPYDSDVEGDLYKYNVDLHRPTFEQQYKEMVTDKNIKIV